VSLSKCIAYRITLITLFVYLIFVYCKENIVYTHALYGDTGDTERQWRILKVQTDFEQLSHTIRNIALIFIVFKGCLLHTMCLEHVRYLLHFDTR